MAILSNIHQKRNIYCAVNKLILMGFSLLRPAQHTAPAATLLFGQGDSFANESHSEVLNKGVDAMGVSSCQ